MIFSVQKENIYNALNITNKAVSTRGIQPVLSNILIETVDNSALKLCSTDLDIAVEIKVEANISKSGSITLPAKKLTEIIAKLPNKTIEFSLNPDSNMMLIKCENTKFDLIGISSSEFPEIALPEENSNSIEVDIEPVLKAIKQTIFATANYDLNNILSGVFIKVKDNSFEMAATDGNRLAVSTKELNNQIKGEFTSIIPSRTLNELVRIISGVDSKSISISIGNGLILFKLEDRYLSSRVLEGQYPGYNQLIPSTYTNFVLIDKSLFVSAIERTATMVNEKTSTIKLSFNNNKLELLADSPDLGDSKDEIDIDYQGEELNIGFNYKYLIDAVKVIDSEKVRIEFNGQNSAAIFKNEDESGYLCLVMPVRIN